MKRSMRFVLCAALLWLLASGTGWAQAVGGSQVSGVVRDASGGVLPGAEVTITKTDTGAIRTVFTDADGSYTLPKCAHFKVKRSPVESRLRSGVPPWARRSGEYCISVGATAPSTPS